MRPSLFLLGSVDSMKLEMTPLSGFYNSTTFILVYCLKKFEGTQIQDRFGGVGFVVLRGMTPFRFVDGHQSIFKTRRQLGSAKRWLIDLLIYQTLRSHNRSYPLSVLPAYVRFSGGGGRCRILVCKLTGRTNIHRDAAGGV